MVIGNGSSQTALAESEIRKILETGTPEEVYVGKRVLVLTPDTTRTCPLPMMVKMLQEIMGSSTKTLDFI